jgi:hypothetical protein
MEEPRDAFGRTAGEKEAAIAGFERASNTGPTCLTCGAVVPDFSDHLDRHRRWHADLDERFRRK